MPALSRGAVRFHDRAEAGRELARALSRRRPGGDLVVLGIPRGGVPVAFEVATALAAPLDVVVVRKLGIPYQPELAFGAVGEGGTRVVDDAVTSSAGLSAASLKAVEARELATLKARLASIRSLRPAVPLAGRTAVVVDDGLATGATARAACLSARARGAARVHVAVPVAPRSSLRYLADVADELEVLETPDPFFAVGEWYEHFPATTDAEVADLLRRSLEQAPTGAGPSRAHRFRDGPASR